MKKSVRTLTLVLALLMLVSVFAACDNNGPETDTTASTQTPTDPNGSGDENLDENGYLKDDIPADTNLNGRVIRVLSWESRLSQMFSEEMSEDEVNNQVYKRQAALEERLNFLFEPVSVPGDWKDQATWLTQGRLCGDNNIDLIGTYSLWPGILAQEGYLCNLNMLEYPNQEMPWWPASVAEWTQSGALYFISSNSSIPVLNSIRVMLCNESLFEDKSLESPVQLALRGEWYSETMLTYVSNFSSDLDAASRVWGFAAWDSTAMDPLYYAAGFDSIKNAEYGEAELAVTSASTMMTVTSYIDRLATMFNDGNATIGNGLLTELNENRIALCLAAFDVLTWLEGNDYSAIPLPKLDENQDNYRTIQHNNYDVWAIPSTAKDKEISGLVLEGLASMDYRQLAPYYFEKYMKLRYSKTEDCMAMFDIIRGSMHYDFGRIMTDIGGVVEAPWRETFWTYSNGGMVKANIDSGYFSTTVQANSGLVQTKLDTILSNFRKYFDVGMSEG